jgi:hypothetical protein
VAKCLADIDMVLSFGHPQRCNLPPPALRIGFVPDRHIPVCQWLCIKHGYLLR